MNRNRISLFPIWSSIMQTEINEFLAKYKLEKIFSSNNIKGLALYLVRWFQKLPEGSHVSREIILLMQKMHKWLLLAKNLTLLTALTANGHVPFIKSHLKISPKDFYNACRRSWSAGVYYFAPGHDAHQGRFSCECERYLGEYIGTAGDPAAFGLCKNWRDRETVYCLAVVNGVQNYQLAVVNEGLVLLGEAPDYWSVKKMCDEWIVSYEMYIENDIDVANRLISTKESVLKFYLNKKKEEQAALREELAKYITSADVCSAVAEKL
jgi:hypothetical protein